MQKEEILIKQLRTALTMVVRGTGRPDFKFPDTPATEDLMQSFVRSAVAFYSDLSVDRIADFCIYAVYRFKETRRWTVRQVFTTATLSSYNEQISQELRYYQDRWLSSAGIKRADVIEAAAEVANRCGSKFVHLIYLPSEERDKMRLLNSKSGYILCGMATLGWSPRSKACAQCNFADKCKKRTAFDFPDLYNARISSISSQSSH